MVTNDEVTTDSIEVTPELMQRYDRPGPRYTSYPTAPEWRDDFSGEEYAQSLVTASQNTDDPMSIYVHVPFCSHRCLFCGCNVVISKRPEIAGPYLESVARELAMAAEALGERREVMQLHWGGGTPTYLPPAEIEKLFGSITKHFTLAPGAEVGIEVDPRVTSREQVALLRQLGFNRISMGVQDLDPAVQTAIDRNQTAEQTTDLFGWSKDEGFLGINIDLIYGLPGQTMEGWSKTIESIIAMRPDRLAVYSYAHLPARQKHQGRLDETIIPTGAEKLELFTRARQLFTEGGYRAIGMDHFAVPEDELATALDERRLHRNFMGYTVVPAADMLGIGPSSIGEIGGCYAQNQKRLVHYMREIDEGRFSTASGCLLSDDDTVRRWLIRQIMCNFYLDTAVLKERFSVDYDTYFAAEEEALQEFYDEGFVAREGKNLKVLPLGQLFIRNVAMVFDTYLKKSSFKAFSRTV